jgi:hypothetical protein
MRRFVVCILHQVLVGFMKCVKKTHKGLLLVQAYSWNIEMTRKGKGRVHPTMSHEGPEGGAEVQLQSFFNLGIRCRLVANATSRLLYPRKRLGTLE